MAASTAKLAVSLIALLANCYRNVRELGPLIDIAATTIAFSGSAAALSR